MSAWAGGLLTAIDSRWTALVRRVFGTHEEPPLALSVQPTFELTSDCAEWYFSRSERLLGFPHGTVAAGGAGTFARAALTNPLGSGRLLVITRIQVQKATAGAAGIWVGMGSAGGAVLGCQCRDTRLGGVTPNIATPYLFNGTAPVLGDFFEVVPVDAALGWASLDVKYAIGPGSNLTVQNMTANEGLTLLAVGYDVPLRGDEGS